MILTFEVPAQVMQGVFSRFIQELSRFKQIRFLRCLSILQCTLWERLRPVFSGVTPKTYWFWKVPRKDLRLPIEQKLDP